MATYNIVKTIFGRQRGTVLDTLDTLEEAREALVDIMSQLEDGSNDNRFVPDEQCLQIEIDLLKEKGADGADISEKMANIEKWITPCVVNIVTYEEQCNARYDSYSYDNYTVEIVEDK